MDRAVLYAILGNLASLVFGPITALLIAVRFSPELQGYYYTFGSLTALQFLAELGLGQAIIQFASHEWSRLHFGPNYQIHGEADSRSRLISLARLSLLWYAAAAAVALITLGAGGFLFFSHSPTPGINWQMPWLVLCALLGLNLCLTPLFYLLQGCNQISSYWLYRLLQQIINGLALWIAIVSGFKLWSMPFAMVIGLLWSLIFLRRYTGFFQAFLIQPQGPRIAWRAEVWPVQWRIAITWMSTYFTNQIFTPVLFRFSGPVVAGQMGMTNTLTNVVMAMSSNWVVTKAPRFGVMIAGRNWRELDRSFFRSFCISLVVAAALAVAAAGLIAGLNLLGSPLAYRVLPPLPASLFLAASVISSALASLTIYLRAHKREPLTAVFLLGSLAIALLAVLLAPQFGATGVGAAYFAVLVLFELPVSTAVFLRLRGSWHSAGPVSGDSVTESL
jgi:O-antigen/teichoic acid export membrane protein